MSHTGEKAQSAKLTLRIKKSIVPWAASLVKADSRLSDQQPSGKTPAMQNLKTLKLAQLFPDPNM